MPHDPFAGGAWTDEHGAVWRSRDGGTTLKRVQRLMALPEVRVLRCAGGRVTELPVGSRGAYWRTVLPRLRGPAGGCAVHELHDEAGRRLVAFVES